MNRAAQHFNGDARRLTSAGTVVAEPEAVLRGGPSSEMRMREQPRPRGVVSRLGETLLERSVLEQAESAAMRLEVGVEASRAARGDQRGIEVVERRARRAGRCAPRAREIGE